MSYLGKIIGNNLRKYRGALTQAVVSGKADMGVVQYGRYERGEQVPTDDVLDRLASALGCPVSALIGGGPEPAAGQSNIDSPPGDPGEDLEYRQALADLKREADAVLERINADLMAMLKESISRQGEIIAALRAAQAEGERLHAELASKNRELEVLRAEVNRLVNGGKPINPLAADQPAAAGPTPGKDPSKYLLNDSSGGRGGDPGVV